MSARFVAANSTRSKWKREWQTSVLGELPMLLTDRIVMPLHASKPKRLRAHTHAIRKEVGCEWEVRRDTEACGLNIPPSPICITRRRVNGTELSPRCSHEVCIVWHLERLKWCSPETKRFTNPLIKMRKYAGIAGDALFVPHCLIISWNTVGRMCGASGPPIHRGLREG